MDELKDSSVTVIEMGDKILRFAIKDFGESIIEIEDLLQIHTHNIVADMVTWPVILNRIANIKAIIDQHVDQLNLEFSIFESVQYEQVKKQMLEADSKPTETSIKMSITRLPEYKDKKLQIIDAQKQADIVGGLYLAAKSKDKKLEVISGKIKPDDFANEILEEKINGVIITKHKNNFVEN